MASAAFRKWLAALMSSGDICPLRLGNTRDELRAFLGAPDAVGGTSRKNNLARIWRYEDTEFHFGPKSNDGLFLIYSEDQAGVVKVSIPRMP